MQCQADECISYLLIIESWTQQNTVNLENNIIFDENDNNSVLEMLKSKMF